MFDVARLTEASRASVVEIRAGHSVGTGWIYRVDNNRKAWILTNEHVIRGSRTVTVRLSDGSGTRTGTVTGADDIRDLAVVTICCSSGWKALPTVAPTEVEVGSNVVIMGFPEQRIGSGLSVTTGIVSSFDFHSESRSWLIQTDAAVNPGNSGGPLLNASGQVIGIVSSRSDPIRAENIGFAIAMRTVDAELDYLEVGGNVRAATPTPTPRATRVPTPGPSAGGVSGVLVHNPGDGVIGCADSRYDRTVISTDMVDSAAFLRFEAPDVSEWSIGFIYHDPEDDSNSHAATMVYGDGYRGTRARHWVRRNGEDVHDPPTQSIPRGTLKTGRGELNELVFRTSSNGSFLRLNDEIVIEVPASQLIRRIGWSLLCIGFHSEEDERYSIRYEDLRTRFVREGASGSLTHNGLKPDEITCPASGENAYISRSVTDSWVILDFTIPAVQKWSIGIVHHGISGFNSRTTIHRNGSSRYAEHTTYRDGDFSDGPSEYLVPSKFKSGQNTIEFETTADGNWLRLNGEKVLDVHRTDLTRRGGTTRLCIELYVNEEAIYTIEYSDLWAWAD